MLMLFICSIYVILYH